MKIDAIVAGSLYSAAKRTTDATGKSIVTAVVAAPIREPAGDGLFANVQCFDEAAANTLLALAPGEWVGIAGELTQPQHEPQPGEPRPSIDVLAHAVLREYCTAMKLKAARQRASADAGDEAA